MKRNTHPFRSARSPQNPALSQNTYGLDLNKHLSSALTNQRSQGTLLGCITNKAGGGYTKTQAQHQRKNSFEILNNNINSTAGADNKNILKPTHRKNMLS
jgi:hypothetical protein